MLGTTFFGGTGSKAVMHAWAREHVGECVECVVQVATPSDSPKFPDGYHNFGCYKTWAEAEQQLAALPPQDRHVFEIIQAGRPCKPYLDLDGDDPPPGCKTVEAVVERTQALVRRVLAEDYHVPESALPDEAFVWTHSPNQAKLSLHLVINTRGPQLVFRSNHQSDAHGASQLMQRLRQLDPEGVGNLLDEGVYSNDREMRMMGSSKLSKPQSVLWSLRPGVTLRDSTITWLDDGDVQMGSVGYDYLDRVDGTAAAEVARYWERLHPDAEQRDYVRRMFARQLYGDSCGNYLHVHAGQHASAGNGKTCCFEALGACGGDYVKKFGMEVLTAKVRPSPGKPMPELATWRGRRVLYCTEPNPDDRLNNGIMKDLTGGERIQYRLLFSNTMREYVPQFKLHLMCNSPPHLDGGDQGVQRRIRKIDYQAKFVDPEEACEAQCMYPRDAALMLRFATDPAYKMALLRSLLDVFDLGYTFPMPAIVAEAGREYLDDNNVVHTFITNHLVAEADATFTMGQAKERFAKAKDLRFAGITHGVLKNALISQLKTACLSEEMVKGKKECSVFVGYRLGPDPTADDPAPTCAFI